MPSTCPTCRKPVTSDDASVVDVIGNAVYHYGCKNPMSGLNAALDAFKAAEKKS